jgi:hypothetical protein
MFLFLKDVLCLNKLYLACVTFWGFFIAFVTLNKDVQKDCASLAALAVFGMVVGNTGDLFYLVFKLIQDSLFSFKCMLPAGVAVPVLIQRCP